MRRMHEEKNKQKMQEGQESRKGPWTEQEDIQLMCFVGLFGDRRWDFIAKVSGLNRTGKSCRLRWVNYLHPGLKPGKITPQEQRLVLQLHSKWGNKWSKIAQKLPGRTDNEIKNYWRTHMRKQAHHKRKGLPSCSSSPSSSSSNPAVEFATDTGPVKFFDSGGSEISASSSTNNNTEENQELGFGYPMDEFWKDIDMSDHESLIMNQDVYRNFSCPPPSWDYDCGDSLWMIDEQSKLIFSGYEHNVKPRQANQNFFN